MNDKQYILAALAIVLLAAGLRFYNLGGTSLWFDEAVYATNSHGSFAEMLEKTRTQNSSPILLPFAFWLLGDLVQSPFWIRFLPMVFGVLVVVVTLQLPRVGIPAPVALVSALWMAVSPKLVEFSQEVREYSLGTLITAGLLFGFLRMLKNPKKRNVLFCAVLFLAPLCSYGTIFMAGSLLGVLLLTRTLRESPELKNYILPVSALSSGIAISYLLTAKYQTGVAEAAYLRSLYPPAGGITESVAWLLQSVQEYFFFLCGGKIPARLSLFFLGFFFMLAIYRRKIFQTEMYLVSTLLVLIAFSMLLSLCGLYPFGGARQQVFAGPLVILAVTASLGWLIQNVSYFPWLILCLILVLPGSAQHLPYVFGERQDIRLPIEDLPPDIKDEKVFVYHGAVPGVRFHYPERKFYFSKHSFGRAAAMEREVLSLGGGQIALVFSLPTHDDDTKIVSALLDNGYMIILDKVYSGEPPWFIKSRLLVLEKP